MRRGDAADAAVAWVTRMNRLRDGGQKRHVAACGCGVDAGVPFDNQTRGRIGLGERRQDRAGAGGKRLQVGACVGRVEPIDHRIEGRQISQRFGRAFNAFALRCASVARDVSRPPSLWPGARQAIPAKGLRADDGPDLVSIDVEVAGLDPARHIGDATLYTAVDTEDQAVAGGVDRADLGVLRPCIAQR
jgi:hypothetical protein